MRSGELSLRALLLAGLLTGCGGGTSGEAPEPPDPCELIAGKSTSHASFSAHANVRMNPVSLQFGLDTDTPENIALVNAFPQLAFDNPVDLAPVPGNEYNIVVEHPGRIVIFENDPDTARTEIFLDITGRVRYDASEQGLVRAAFDPDYANNGHVYVTYAGRSSVNAELCAEQCSVISRFTRSPSNPRRLDPGSEEIVLILRQPGIWHNVGNLLFGSDGHLYVGVGDGGVWLDEPANAQNRTNLFGSILRIDVSGELPYRVPADNPFVGAGLEEPGVVGAGEPVREEIWAFGFRNPHRFSIDPVTGQMWLADVGEGAREELNQVVRGGNYGWPAFEGSMSWGRTDIGRAPNEYRFPALEYGRDEGASITGGHIYRGNAIPALYEHYLFADFISGTVWAAELQAAGRLGEKQPIASAGGLSVAAIGIVDGEPHFVNKSAGTIQRFDPDAGCDGDGCAPAPQHLSETGIFSDLATLTTTPGLMPYDVIAPLWSDGTDKLRWLALPADTAIDFDETGAWAFPPGTVLVKHFAIDLDRTGTCNARRNLETRVLVHARRGWIGYTYRWNEAQTDAELLAGSRSEELTIRTDSGLQSQTYTYPSTSDCAICHNATAGHVLGVRTRQLNRDFAYVESTENQLAAMSRLGFFEQALAVPESYEQYADPYSASADLGKRARSYLAANCAQCHNPDSVVPAAIDLRFDTSDALMNTIDVSPNGSDMGATDSRIIAPGDRSRSTLWLRLATRDAGRMPPLASHVVDEQAVAMIGEWIDAMAP